MAEPGKIIRSIINAAIFIAMEIAALNMLSRNGAIQNFFISKAAHAVMGRLWGAGEDVRSYFNLRKANDRLAQENIELHRRIMEYTMRLEDAGRDTAIVRPDTAGNFRYQPAKIIKISRNKQHNYLILGQGYEDGVQPRSGVITSNGVVGIVDAVSRHYAYAISLQNSNLNISARIGREGAVGPLSWDGMSRNGAILEEISLQYRFEKGDTVYTSGYSSLFPADIPVGVVRDSKIVNGATYEIGVDLFQDFNALRYVTLVTNIGVDEIGELEKDEDMEEK